MLENTSPKLYAGLLLVWMLFGGFVYLQLYKEVPIIETTPALENSTTDISPAPDTTTVEEAPADIEIPTGNIPPETELNQEFTFAEPLQVNFSNNTKALESDDPQIFQLNSLVSFLQSNSNIKVRVDGYIDDVGEERLNRYLARKRTLFVSDFLKDNSIPADRIEINYKNSVSDLPSGKVGVVTVKYLK